MGFVIKPVRTREEVAAMNRIYAVRNMVPVDADFLMQHRQSRKLTYFVAKDTRTNEVCGEDLPGCLGRNLARRKYGGLDELSNRVH